MSGFLGLGRYFLEQAAELSCDDSEGRMTSADDADEADVCV
jgi:hypothetical protein